MHKWQGIREVAGSSHSRSEDISHGSRSASVSRSKDVSLGSRSESVSHSEAASLGSRLKSVSRGLRDEPVDSEETHPHPHPPQQKIMRYKEEISFDADGRVILYIEAGLLCPTSKFRGACTASFRRKLEPTGYNWPSVSPSMKETYWGELQKSCYWDETKISTSFVRARWEKIAGIAYKDFVSRVKRKAEKGEFKKIKGVLPHVLKAWMVEWQKPEVKAKSSQASKHRHSGPDGPGTGPVIHHGGSRGTHLIAKCVALSEGIPFEHTGLPTHMILHKVNGVWTDPRSQRIYEEVQRRVDEERAPLPGSTEWRHVTPARVEEIYREECKVDRKGHMIGKGCLSEMYASQCSKRKRSSSIPIQTQYEARIQEHEAKLAAQKEEMEARLKQQRDEAAAQEKQRSREFLALKENMDRVFAFMSSSPGFDSFQSRFQPPPPPPP